LLGRRIPQHRLEEEAVLLGFGQRIGPLVLDRVLGGEHHEGVRKRHLLPFESDAALLHRLQQRRLDLGRRPVDLVGEEDVGEDRPLPDPERSRLQIIDRCADDIGGHQVRRELDTTVLHRHQAGHRLGEQSLADARHALQQHMAASHDGERAEAHGILLPDDRLGGLRPKLGVKLGGLH